MAAIEPFFHQPYLCQHRYHGRFQFKFAIVLRVFDLRRAAFRTMESFAQYLSVGLPPLVENLFCPSMFLFVDQDVVRSVGFTHHPALLPFALVINDRMQSGLLELLGDRLRVFGLFEGQNCDWFHKFTPLIVKPCWAFTNVSADCEYAIPGCVGNSPPEKALNSLRKRYFAVDTPRFRRV